MGLIEEVTLSRLGGSEGHSPDIFGNKENDQCKGPGVGSMSMCRRKNKTRDYNRVRGKENSGCGQRGKSERQTIWSPCGHHETSQDESH